MNHLVCFGFGYTARALCRRLDPDRWRITATVRHGNGEGGAGHRDVTLVGFGDGVGLPAGLLEAASHILTTIPPDEHGDPVVRQAGRQLAAAAPRWVGYLSSTGVYGDRAGAWVDEDTPIAPASPRARRRADAEAAWLELLARHRLPVHIFRLPGIYGPGRSPVDQLLAGTARRIVKPGHVFCRIHVDDIAGVLIASMARPRPGAVYNVCDDLPAAASDVVAHAASLLGRPPPDPVDIAQADLSPAARSFYDECKRVANRRIKSELGYRLAYPTYREGLAAIAAAGSKT